MVLVTGKMKKEDWKTYRTILLQIRCGRRRDCHAPSVPALATRHAVLSWRRPSWWSSGSACGLKVDPANLTRWKHSWGHQNRGVVRDTAVSSWAGRQESVGRRGMAEGQ